MEGIPFCIFLHAFLTDKDIEKFTSEFPNVKHYQWVEGYFYAIHVKTEQVVQSPLSSDRKGMFGDHSRLVRPFSFYDYYKYDAR